MERFGFVEALVEAGRLGQWDEDDRGAIDHAVATILSDWHVAVTRDGVDPIASDIVRRRYPGIAPADRTDQDYSARGNDRRIESDGGSGRIEDRSTG